MKYKKIIEQLAVGFNQEKFIHFLKNELPPENDRKYEIILTKIAMEISFSQEEIFKVLDDSKLETVVRYAAFVILCTYYRRFKDISKYHKLLEKHRKEFEGFCTYQNLYSLFLQQRRKRKDLLLAIKYAKKALNKEPNHSGINHNFAKSVVTAIEEKENVRNKQLLLKQAKKAVDYAIIKEDYAQFYCTKARLLAIMKKFNKAKQFILIAIDKEESSRKDYVLRISEYEIYLMKIKLYESYEEIKKEIDRAHNEIQSGLTSILQERTRNIEFLSFFVAIMTLIMTLIITGINFTKSPNVLISSQFILSFTGTLLIAFSGLSFLLYDLQKIIRSLIIFSLGLTTSLVGVNLPSIIHFFHK